MEKRRMKQETINYIKENWEKQRKHVLRIAEDAIEQKFLFDLPWDMERTYETVKFEKEIDWEYQPGNDPEFVFQFNRHMFFLCLGKAYQMTGEEKYVSKFAELFHDWTKKNPVPEEKKTTCWRTIEAGIRGEIWTKAMGLMEKSSVITEEFRMLFQKALQLHGEYLANSDTIFQKKSNWGVLESSGLLAIACYLPKERKTEEWKGLAINRLSIQSEIQIMGDGMQWEQSPMYHNEVYHCYLEVVRLAKLHNLILPEVILENTKKMAYANLAWKKPNHCQIAMGDSDETDVRDLITHGAYLFQDPVLKFGGYERLDFDGIWDFGEEAILEYENLEKQSPDFKNIWMQESGNYYLRSGWEEEADFFHFRCGSLGGGHGHSDKLHIDIVWNGEDILLDSGRYTYVSGEERTLLKSAFAHNVPIVDRKDYLVIKDAWGVENTTPPMNSIAKEMGRYTYFQGGHAGYVMSDGVFVNRKIVAIGTDIFVIMDEFFAGGEHEAAQYFHFNNQGILQVDENKRLIQYSGEKAKGTLFVLTEDAAIEKAKTLISRNYNQKENAEMIKIVNKKNGFQTLFSVIAKDGWEAQSVLVQNYITGGTFDAAIAEGVKIQKGDIEYYLFFHHSDIANPSEIIGTDELYGIGRIQAYRVQKEEKERTVLEW